jgi:nitrate reductase beta subunit
MIVIKKLMNLILYTKTGCHLCEGLQEKIEQITAFPIELELRDITTNEDWYNLYQYEVPVLFYQKNGQEIPISRPSPRISVVQLEKNLAPFAS